ncbi:MAP kinase kinase kinase mkh1 [Termitomyces sp. T112]|nr:MAP kinase kinase kinase mkh1 [Termitomyces sp. T112]
MPVVSTVCLPDQIRQFTTAPPLLPNWLTFKPDENVVSSYTSHGCTASDAAIEHEQSLRAADQYSLRTRPYALGAGLHPQPSKENLSPSKDRQNRYATEEDPIQSNSWVVVNGRSDDQEPSPPTQETTATVLPQSAARPSQSSSRRIISPYTGCPLAIPTPPQHPAPVPMPSHEVHETQPPPRPSAGVPLPSKLFAWRGEQRTLSSSNQWNRMPKGSKSVDNLRALNNNLAIQRPPPLPMSRPTGQAPLIPSYSPYSSGLPRSYDSRTPPRPLPMRGPLYGSAGELGREVSTSRGASYNLPSSQDPYPCPQSASGDSMNSLTTHRHRMQSPTDSGDNI